MFSNPHPPFPPTPRPQPPVTYPQLPAAQPRRLSAVSSSSLLPQHQTPLFDPTLAASCSSLEGQPPALSQRSQSNALPHPGPQPPPAFSHPVPPPPPAPALSLRSVSTFPPSLLPQGVDPGFISSSLARFQQTLPPPPPPPPPLQHPGTTFQPSFPLPTTLPPSYSHRPPSYSSSVPPPPHLPPLLPSPSLRPPQPQQRNQLLHPHPHQISFHHKNTSSSIDKPSAANKPWRAQRSYLQVLETSPHSTALARQYRSKHKEDTFPPIAHREQLQRVKKSHLHEVRKNLPARQDKRRISPLTRCLRCLQRGHLALKCSSEALCFNCFRPGHLKARCKAKEMEFSGQQVNSRLVALRTTPSMRKAINFYSQSILISSDLHLCLRLRLLQLHYSSTIGWLTAGELYL